MSAAVLRPPDCENLAGQDTGRQSISPTRLSVFLACHRKYELKHIQRLEPIRKKRSLSLGGAFQKAIELGAPEAGVLALQGYTDRKCPECDGAGVLYVGMNRVGPVGEGCDRCDGGVVWTEPDEPLRFYDQAMQDSHDVDCAIVRGASALYLEHWPEPLGEEREFEFRVRLRSPWTGHYSQTFDLHGYADGLVPIWSADHSDAYEIVENKLVGSVSPIKVQRLPLDRQLALIRYAVWRATGRPVVQVRYRWIKKPSIKRKQKESNSDFCQRVIDDYADRPDFYLHEESPKWTTTEDLLRIEAELWTWAEDIRTKTRRGSALVFDRNTSHCTEWGGCSYIPVCTGDPDAMSLYYVRPPHAPTADPEAEEATA